MIGKIKQRLHIIAQASRTIVAIARWLIGAPFMNLRMIWVAGNKEAARRIFVRSAAKWLKTCRIKVDLSGTPPPPGAGCVVCYNETSFADVFAMSEVLMPHLDRAAAADVYAWIPFARAACRRADIELVPRGNRAATELLMDKVIEAVKDGERLAWGGEGRLSGKDGVLRFKVGASLIAIRAQAPIIPVAFYGGHQTFPLRSIRARPGKILVRIGDPIETAGLCKEDARDLADRVQAAVADMYAELGEGS